MQSPYRCARVALVTSASAFAMIAAAPAFGQQAAPAEPAEAQSYGEEIIVTAQRQAEALQDVPIAVSAFTGQMLERQQIENASDLQLTLPNVTFTKTNFTSSSFTIRGIGDLCVGFSCDQATGIHVNDMPLVSTRLFETEYFDLERVEVLRGPQGTLFGRNATSGVVNFITAKPEFDGLNVKADAEYGNFDAVKLQGVVNIPLTDTIAVRAAGYYVNRNGYTKNLFDGSRIDGRDLYALRGTVRWQPSDDTTLDIIGYYFHERDDRSRVQKQLCHRDPTGILGCSPDRLANETLNANATISGILTSREFLRIQNPALEVFGLNSLYGPDYFSNAVNPTDVRTVNIDTNPTYFADELQIMGRLEQRLGDALKLTVTGGYAENSVDSRTDYNLAAANSLTGNPGLLTLIGASQLPGSPFANAVGALLPGGLAGGVCTSEVNLKYTGVFGGNVFACGQGGIDYDRSQADYRQYSIEGHIDSNLDGPFNFLLGGIYVDTRNVNSNYYVASFGLDYAAGVIGGAATGGAAYLAPPFFNSEVNRFSLKSYGLFGEMYFEATDRLKFTAGLRYSNDRKRQIARVPLLEFTAPYGVENAFDSPFAAGFDADPSQAGAQVYNDARAKFDEFTGRFVVDYQLTDDNLLYASYSRGYKSGGINPPLDPQFNVPITFEPEIVDAFEIGFKNVFGGGTFGLNLAAFYYKYNKLQLSRIIARTSVNDNTDADIYGLEAEAIIRPDPAWQFNVNASYLHTKIKDLQLVDPHDVSGGRDDVVIIKDITNGSNCAIVPTVAGAPRADAVVDGFNSAIGLQGTTPVPGTNTTGAFSICNVAGLGAGGTPNDLGDLIAALSLPYRVVDGVPVDLTGNQLPNAPHYKVSAGAQYTADFANGMSLVPRADVAFTSEYYARSFNRNIDRIPSYVVVNAQLQLNGPDERWYIRGFVQNLFDNNAVTGEYVTDQSSGLFTNIFTLEPRRYGVGAGFRF